MLSARILLRRFGAVLWTAASMLIIAAAIVVGLAQLLLPFAPRFQPEIESWLSQQLHRPVTVAEVGADWETTGPVLRLAEVKLGEGTSERPPLTLEEAEVGINLLAWLMPGGQLANFRIARTHIELTREADGTVRLEGLGPGRPTASLDRLFELGSVSLVDCRLTVVDQVRGVRMDFAGIDVTLDNRGSRHRLAGRLTAAESAGTVAFQLLFTGNLDEHRVESAEIYLQGEGVDLPRWLAGIGPDGVDIEAGRGDFRVWADVADGRLASVRATGDLTGLDVVGAPRQGADDAEPAGVHRRFQRLGGIFGWSREDGGWRLTGEHLSVVRNGRRWPGSGFTVARSGNALRFGFDYLRLDDLAALAGAAGSVARDAGRVLSALSPVGELRDPKGAWHFDRPAARALTLKARLDDVGWSRWEQWPGLTGISGRLDVTDGQGTLALRSREASLDFPRLFRGRVPAHQVRALVSWRPDGAGWRLSIPHFRLSADGSNVLGRLSLAFQGDGSRPWIDLRARVTGGDASQAGAYFPVGIMHPDLVGWLDQALVAGTLVRARAVAYGDLDDWPFDDGAGKFEVRGKARDAVLNYREGWPRVEGASAQLLFEGRSMHVTARDGHVFGVRANRAEASIEDLKQPLLKVHVDADGPTADMLRFLRESPLNDRFGPYLSGLEATAQGQVSAEIRAPLKEEMGGELQVKGTATLGDSRVVDHKWDLSFEHLAGAIHFDQDGFETRDMSGRFRGQPVKLWMAVGQDADPAVVARGRLEGVMPPATLMKDFPILSPLLDHLAGASLTRLDLAVHREPGGGEPDADLKITSELGGTAVTLPAPLKKPAGEKVPLVVELPMPYTGQPLSWQYGDRLSGLLHPASPQGIKGHLTLGVATPSMPSEPGILIDGRAGVLDVDDWYDFIEGLPGGGEAIPVRRMSIKVDRMAALERDFDNVSIDAVPAATGWRAELDSAQLEGTLQLPTEASDQRSGVVADFRHLVIPPVPEGRAGSAVDPRHLPSLHVVADDFTLNDIALGRTRIEAYPTEDGLRFDMLKAESGAMALQGDGTWTVAGDDQKSDFDMTITAEDLGNMLSVFGYAGYVQGGQTVAELDVSWPGAPSEFSLERIGGDLKVSVGPGRMVSVEPGAGRIFGLLSLQTLPRRLMLDFSDLFRSGLSFDAIQGSFKFSGGEATTDDLTLTGPTALIRVTGRVGLAKRDYDQVVTVVPGVGNTLPLVGALAGGPAGAAAMFVLKNIFEEQIGQMTSYRYSITGPWDDPVIKSIEEKDEKGESVVGRRKGGKGGGH